MKTQGKRGCRIKRQSFFVMIWKMKKSSPNKENNYKNIQKLSSDIKKVKKFSYHFHDKTGKIIAYKTHGPIRRIKIWTQ